MTRKKRKEQAHDREAKLPDEEKHRQPRRLPSRYDILIQCRDEAEQHSLFERLHGEGLRLRLLVL